MLRRASGGRPTSRGSSLSLATAAVRAPQAQPTEPGQIVLDPHDLC